MLGNIVRGRPGEAFLVWARHGQEIIPLDTPPADARLLLSLTLPESKFRTALSEHPGK
jgi:hypothetical protein